MARAKPLEIKTKLEIKKLRPRKVEICDYIRVVQTPYGGYDVYINGVKQSQVVAFSINLTSGAAPKFQIARIIQ